MDKSSAQVPRVFASTGSLRKWRDGALSYGWVSIVLHWLAAILLIALWFLGDAISFTSEAASRTISAERHVSLAVTAFVLLALRVIWRLWNGYPRFKSQHPLDKLFSRCTHSVMLVSILVMLVSGPVLAMTGDKPLNLAVGGQLPLLTDLHPSLRYLAYRFHSTGATVLLLAILLHVCGACKHLMFNDDDVFVRMLFPGSRD